MNEVEIKSKERFERFKKYYISQSKSKSKK